MSRGTVSAQTRKRTGTRSQVLVSAPTKITADATTGNLFLKKVILLVDIFQKSATL
jgi:ERCC4-related helicase